jgi:hypothetical protein
MTDAMHSTEASEGLVANPTFTLSTFITEADVLAQTLHFSL